MTDHLSTLYGEEIGIQIFQRIQELLNRYEFPKRLTGKLLDQTDSVLITYGDQVFQPGDAPLRSLGKFCAQNLQGVVSGLHILPFYPYSSDDGFSVIDYKQVDPKLGDWEDIHLLGKQFRLMFDAVINHISAQSTWFQRFLNDRPPYRDYFIVIEGAPDLSRVVRPRTHPLLTDVITPSGKKSVWTTFSADQVDLDFHNPGLLLEILDTLLFYIQNGADFIRLDAIAYLWKEAGTTCIHLPQTHQIVQLIRAMLERSAPYVQIITETNVPHAENISYFGDQGNEAHMVYNFALPPLVLHTIGSGNANAISRWAAGLSLPFKQVTFFNFLASHDGIGVTPANGLITEADISTIIQRVQAHGGLVSYRSNPDGTQSPYELNINYFDALSDPEGGEPLEIQIRRFLAAHAIMLSLVGLPAIYFHSLFGSRGWREGVEQTGRNRTINRQKLILDELQADLANPGSLRRSVFSQLAHMLRMRATNPAFHPYGEQRVLANDERVFSIIRLSPDRKYKTLCLLNVSPDDLLLKLKLEDLREFQAATFVDILTQQIYSPGKTLSVELTPYQSVWLTQ